VGGFKFGFTMSPMDEVNSVFRYMLRTSEKDNGADQSKITSIFKTTLRKPHAKAKGQHGKHRPAPGELAGKNINIA